MSRSRSRSRSRANEEFIDRLCAESTPLTADEERALAERVAAGDAAAREALIQANYRLAAYWARRYVGHTISTEDLFSEAVAAICHATDLFKLDRGIRFSTYASFWIRQRFGRALRRQGAFRISTRVELGEFSCLPRFVELGEWSRSLERGDDPRETPIGQAIQREEAAALHAALSLLTPRQREYLTRSYELDGQHRGRHKDVVNEVGIARTSFRNTEMRGLRNLRRILDNTMSSCDEVDR